MKKLSLISITFLLISSFCFSQSGSGKIYWKTTGNNSIVWNTDKEQKLPHSDNIEMAGRKVAAIIYYTIDAGRKLSLEREVYYPQLRTYDKTTDSGWKKYRAYFKYKFTDNLLPVIMLDNKLIEPGPVDSVAIEGMLTFYHQPVMDIRIVRTFFPSMKDRLIVEKWELQNKGKVIKQLKIGNIMLEKKEAGYKGIYTCKSYSDSNTDITLYPDSTYTFAIYYAAALNDEPIDQFNYKIAEKDRLEFLKEMKNNLVLKTPNDIINTLFYFSKIRAAENIFETRMGLVHSPGGGNYYAGIWANDQCEYSSPFFPFLGYEDGNTAAYNAYKWFLKNRPADNSPIWSSFEIEGELTCCGGDRGDAAMIAFGLSQYLLARGDKNIAIELWPLLEWCLNYCDLKKNDKGVIKSETDEMEGRISTGDANLATSCLYYGGLKYAVCLAKELGKKDIADLYAKRAKEMAASIESYFGANIEGLKTYKYYDGNTYLRHWICLPLVMGFTERKEGTLEALFDKLWTENGVIVELNPDSKAKDLFWDRGTLYALRGAFKVGATELSMKKLIAFSEKRLVGDHVPYVVEAYPENNMRHLSAESALYCRIFTEGLLGIEQTGFKSFTFTPYIPEYWNAFKLENIRAFNSNFSIELEKANKQIKLLVTAQNKVLIIKMVKPGEKITVKL
jgi:hypothetical protein